MSIKFVALVLVWLALAISVPVAAQQTASPSPNAAPQPTAQSESPQQGSAPAQPTPPPQTSVDKDKDKAHVDTSGEGKVAGTSNDRLLFALPNFLTVQNAGKIPPLTSGQKFKVVARGAFDKIEYPWYGLLSGISQAEDSEPGFGQGAAGYAKRYGATFADGTIENFMVGAVLPSLLHQDPRFFQSSEGGFFRRAGYAVSRIVVTRTDSGHTQFNYSEIIGSALSATISTNSYHPRSYTTLSYSPAGAPIYVHHPSDRTLTNTASVWGTQVAYDTITIVIKEFWPDIHRKLSHNTNEGVAAEPSSPSH